MRPVIGILGGMGPRATVQFEFLLLNRLRGGDQQLPTIISINDGSIPDRSDFILGTGPDPLPGMQRNLQQLELLGADIICIPCNTACSPQLFDRLQFSRGNVLNLPAQTIKVIVGRGMQKVMLLATDGTIRGGAYQALCAANGVGCVVPDDASQQLVMRVVRAVKSGNLDGARRIGCRLAETIRASGCDGVILGCTELPMVQDILVPDECVAVDSLAVLADACVRYTKATQTEETAV